MLPPAEALTLPTVQVVAVVSIGGAVKVIAPGAVGNTSTKLEVKVKTLLLVLPKTMRSLALPPGVICTGTNCLPKTGGSKVVNWAVAALELLMPSLDETAPSGIRFTQVPI